jgi:hypothetical protein
MPKATKVLVLLGLVTLALPPLPAEDLKPGSIKARWPIKTSVPADAKLDKPGTLLPLADFLALTPAAEHATTDFQTKRYPKADGGKFAEGQIVRTRGYMRVVAGEPDGDYHIQISETNDTFEDCLVVEVPKDDAVFVENDKPVVEAAKSVRGFVMARITKGKDPVGHVMAIKGPAYVEVTGQLFFDSEHQAGMAKGVFRGKSINGKQLPSKTSWEIHPITNLAFAPVPK